MADFIEVPVTLRLPKHAFNKIVDLVPGDSPGATKVSDVVNGYLLDLSEGGVMLGPEEAKRIAEVLDDPSPETITAAVEEAAGMERGQAVAKWVVDPNLIDPLKEVAHSQGVSVQELIQNMMDTAVTRGWFYEMGDATQQIFMSRDDCDVFRELLGLPDGKHFTGADIIEWLKREGIIASPDSMAALIQDNHDALPVLSS